MAETHEAVETTAGGGEEVAAAAPVRRSPGHRAMDVRDAVAELTARAHEISAEASNKMAGAMRDVIGAAAGFASFAIESARDLVQYMVRRGQMSQDEADRLLRDAEAAVGRQPKPPATDGAAAQPSVFRAKAAKPVEAKEPAAEPAKPAAKAAPRVAPKAAKPPAAEPEREPARPAPKVAAKATKPAAKSAAPAKAPAKAAPKVAAKAPAKGAKPAAKAAKSSPKSAAKAPAKAAKPAAKGASSGAKAPAKSPKSAKPAKAAPKKKR